MKLTISKDGTVEIDLNGGLKDEAQLASVLRALRAEGGTAFPPPPPGGKAKSNLTPTQQETLDLLRVYGPEGVGYVEFCEELGLNTSTGIARLSALVNRGAAVRLSAGIYAAKGEL